MSAVYGQFLLLFGLFFVSSRVNADGRVFVLDLKNSSGLVDYREAERACAAHQARLASADELRHAVAECYFSLCTRGWLHGGTVGMTVCNVVGGSLKAVDVRTENATDDSLHLDTFCIKDKGVPCGDPPSFPNARLQVHSGFEMGDELLYACAPGYTMPNGGSAFSLLCDSCGEWYGLVQICMKDETESHIDYEDKFTDTYVEVVHQNEYERPEEAHGQVFQEQKNFQQQEVYFGVKGEGEYPDEDGDQDEGKEVAGPLNTRDQDEERAAEDLVGQTVWEQESREEVKTDEEATEAPVSLLSQKHLFWFPSEAFTNPIAQTTQRTSGVQSEESKENESKEDLDPQQGFDPDDHDDTPESDHDIDDHEDVHDHTHPEDQDDPDSHQEEDDLDDNVKQYIPGQQEDFDRNDRYEDEDNHDDHYDMGEHEDDDVHYNSHESDDRHESFEEPEDVTDDHTEDASEEHTDDDEHDEHDVIDQHTDHEDSHEHDDHDDHLEHDGDDGHEDHDDPNDHDDHDDHLEHDDDFSREDDNQKQVIFSIARDESQNKTKKGEGEKTTDDTWLDGHPVSQGGKEKGKDMTGEGFVKATDRPNDVEQPHTRSPSDQMGVEVWPEVHTPTASSENQLDSPTFPDSLDYNTQQEAPTHSWMNDLTDHPYLDHGPAPPLNNKGTGKGGNVQDLPGQAGERGKVEGEMGDTICVGENCPPTSPSRAPTVAAIIAAVCVIAAAVIIGVWCYRQRQQKSSMYEMNGTGQTQTHQAQQIEMQQKV
ncbi:uncharacterized protein susd5 [Synchiropus picturatus]